MFESKKVGDGVVAEFNDITGEIELISDYASLDSSNLSFIAICVAESRFPVTGVMLAKI